MVCLETGEHLFASFAGGEEGESFPLVTAMDCDCDWEDVAELKSAWDINLRDLAKAATAAMDNQADIYICLAKARAILSPRGDKYAKMRDEAGILNPKTGKRLTWIEYYAWFQSQYNFDKCLRTVQFKLAEMSGKKRVTKNPDPPLQLTAADKHKLVDSALESHHLVEAIRNGGDVNTAVKELQKNLPPKDKLQDIADNAARVLNSDDGVKTPKSVALCKTVNIPSEIDPNLASETLSVLSDVSKQLQQGELAIRVRHLLNKLIGRMNGSGVTPKAFKQEVIPPAKKNVAQLNVPYIKVAENLPARIAFVPGAKIVGAPVHYSSGENRYYVCDSKPGKRGKCCEKLGDAKGRAAAFVFHYLNADQKTAKLATGTVPQVEVGIFTMSRSNWDDVKGAVEEGVKITDCDFRVSVEEKQLARKIHVIARVARWREIEAAALALAAPIIADNSQLTRALGRKYEATVGIEDARLGDIENL